MNISYFSRFKTAFFLLTIFLLHLEVVAHTASCSFGVNIAHGSVSDREALKQYVQPHNQTLYTAINQEIEALRFYYNNNHHLHAVLDGEVFFTSHGLETPAAAIAPVTYSLLKDVVQNIAHAGGIAMPDIALHLNPSPGTVNEYAFNAYAVSAIYPNFIAVDEELLKLFLWNQNGKELLHAILSHELGHIKYQHGGSEIKNEHEADAFAVKILPKPTMLIKSLDLTMLAGALYFALHQNQHTVHDVAQTTRVLANYAIDTLPKLGTLSKAKTNKAFMYIINIIIKQPTPITHIHNHGSFPDNVVLDLTRHMKHTFNDKTLMKNANNHFRADIGNETHPSPFERRRFIKACIKAKKYGATFPVVRLAWIDDMQTNSVINNPLDELFDLMEARG